MSIEGKAAIIGSGGLRIAPRTFEAPCGSDVLVKVAAAGLNRADILQMKGLYPAPPGAPADIPGLEYAGEVAAVGPNVREAKVGDRVMGIVGGGAMASHVQVHERELIPIPRGMEFAEAAAIPEVFLTVWDALIVQAGLGAGQTLLIHAAASGIGTAAIQLARAVGAIPVGTSRSADKLERCRELGLEHSILVGEEVSFADAVQTCLGRKADVILDTIGASYLAENLRALADRGTIVVLGLLGGAKAPIHLGTILTKRAQVIGSVLRSRALEEKASLAQDFGQRGVPLFERGNVRPVVGACRPMEELESAYGTLERNETFGKVVMVW